jgi:hypothetical protein
MTDYLSGIVNHPPAAGRVISPEEA